ncbi:MAG: hypothetical protein O2948_06640 [Proteobacteria bacterium]|nr:hypothetical protein [Pseudomonadota bacterium]MDA0928329.1 hypothetical protein [Pseudomonadota bacterium]
MNEQERVAYLRSMGYQVYYPRFILPGAKPSPHYEMPADSVVNSVASERGKSEAKIAVAPAAGGSAAARELTRPATTVQRPGKPAIEKPPASSKPVAGKPSAAITPPVAPVQEVVESLRFNLQYFPISESLAVINESPHMPGGRQGKEVQELLMAILRALSVRPPTNGLQSEQFNWPLAEGLEVAGDARRAAGLALQGFISHRQEQDRFQNLLVFTAQLADLLGPRSDKRDEHYGDHGAVAAGYQLCISHSLPAMIAHPQLKREVWAHLQALRGRLQVQQ